jgi:molecular chaperone DnaK (HSP70)
MSDGIDIKTSPYVIGIDLGTSNSSASVYIKGMPAVFPIDGDRTLPSVVYFKDKKKDARLVGKSAKKQIFIHPDATFSSIKRLMKNDEWQKDSQLNEKFNIKDNEKNDVTITPTEIAAEILKELLEKIRLQTTIDLRGQVKSAVICVPANTTDEYRQNVYKAAELAGLGIKNDNGNVLVDESGVPKGVMLLEEPTAAAYGYAHDIGIFGNEKEQVIMVYDLGGGTFDVTILHVDSTEDDKRPKFTVKATKGVSQLGGDDLDKIIMDFCVEDFKEIHGIDIYDLKSDDEKAITQKALKTAQQRLKEKAEETKIAFANNSKKEEISIPEFIKDGGGKTYDLQVELKRVDFINAIKPLLDQANECVTDTLKEANLTLDDINRIILVGGSTKAEWVIDSIKSLYPEGEERTPFRADDVDLIVAKGAAVYGSPKPVETAVEEKSAEDIREAVIESIVSHHLGIELEMGTFGLVLEKGLPLDDSNPVQMGSRIFGNQADMDTIQIMVYKTQKTIDVEEINGERKPKEKVFISEKDSQGNPIFECIGEFVLKGVPKGPRGSEKIEVTMEINQVNLLKVSAKVLSKGTQEEIELNITKN